MNSVKDYYGIEFKVGDTVTFPDGKGFMDGTVEKFRSFKHYTPECFVKNASGNKKWKVCTSVIAKSVIKDSSPELFV